MPMTRHPSSFSWGESNPSVVQHGNLPAVQHGAHGVPQAGGVVAQDFHNVLDEAGAGPGSPVTADPVWSF